MRRALVAALVAALALPPAAGGAGRRTARPVGRARHDHQPGLSRLGGGGARPGGGDGADIVILRLDTPGGLDSTRDIVKDILAAPMPVVVYVSPNGARAASAGLFITQAADVAAMAPETIGSTPISLEGGEQDEVLGRKVRNDAAAYVRALAEATAATGTSPSGWSATP